MPYGPTKFRSISIKLYFLDDQQPVPDSPTSTQIPQTEIPRVEISSAEISQTETPPADISLIELAAKSPSTTLASLTSIKQGHGRPRKYLE